MQLTADDVRSVVFDQSRPFSRGYNEEQVDAFLDLVAETIEVLSRKMGDKQADTGRIISEARRNAEAIVQRAQAIAGQIEEEARARAASIIADASRRGAAAPARPAPPAPPVPAVVNEEIAAAAVEVGTRLGGIRDALSAELANLYRLIGRVQNGAGGYPQPPGPQNPAPQSPGSQPSGGYPQNPNAYNQGTGYNQATGGYPQNGYRGR